MKLLLLCILTTMSSALMCMDLAPHNPGIAAPHERMLRGFKEPSTETIQKYNAAIAYFNKTDHPNRTFWLRQCDAAKVIIAHIENELTFNALLTQERMQPDKERWARIQPLLEYVHIYGLDVEAPLKKELLSLHDKKKITHDTWAQLVAQFKLPNPQKVAPPLPPLPPLPPSPESNKKSASKPLKSKPKQTQQNKSKGKKSVQQKDKKKKKTAAVTTQPPKPTPTSIAAQTLKQQHHEAFHVALMNNNLTALEELLTTHKKFIDLDAQIEKSFNPLGFAATQGNAPLCALLLKHGANPNATSTIQLIQKKGWLKTTALLIAIKLGHFATASELLLHKADPNIPAIRIPSRFEEHALCVAGNRKQDAILKLLLLYGANHFCGKVLFFDTQKQRGYELKLKQKDDQLLLPPIIAGTQKITCSKNQLMLQGSPVFAQEEDDSESLDATNPARAESEEEEKDK